MNTSYGVFRIADNFCKVFDVSHSIATQKCNELNNQLGREEYYVDECTDADFKFGE